MNTEAYGGLKVNVCVDCHIALLKYLRGTGRRIEKCCH